MLFRIGLALIALHIVDDSFVQPQPGTSAGDHLAGGLIPLALLALAAWAFPRLRGGRQGALALVVGTFGVFAGIEAFYYTREVGPSGDDFTGLLSLAAGLLVIGVGVTTLWRTRRHDGARARRYGRRAALGVAGAFVAFWLVLPVVIMQPYTHIGRAVVPEPKLGAAHEDVSFRTSDGLKLEGWYVPSRNGASVIVFPGRQGTQKATRVLVRHGYGVLLFDRRGEGHSEGDPNALGWGGARDVDAAVKFLQRRPDVEPGRIGGIGRSVGGELLLESAAHNRGLAAVVSEGAGWRMTSEELSDEIAPVEKVLSAPSVVVKNAALSVFANEPAPSDLSKLIPKIAPRPVLLINAKHKEAGHKHADYVRAAKAPKESWLVPKGGHVGALSAMPEEYERRVVGFLDRSLLDPR